MSQTDYNATIGIETHVQLNTKTKLFAAVGNDARDAQPNSLISHICVGMPGALPVLNQAAIDLCAKVAFALNTLPQKFSRFERKHYFYPDLPKGYQITQLEDPIIKGGEVKISVDNKDKTVSIERANLEEDAGKNTHPVGADYSLVDLNRAGTPLLEIVSKPDLNSPAEAKAYARELWLLMKYAGVTEGDLYQGHVRFDVNVSISKDSNLGTRSEIKNLNSFRSVEASVAYEIKRQTELLQKGGTVVQETRGWDEAKQKSTSQRSKEEAEDYRYMPEPDIPPVELDDEYIERAKESMAQPLTDIREELSGLDINSMVVEDLLDQEPENVNKILSFIKVAGPRSARRAVFWVLETGILDPKRDKELSEMLDNNEISSSTAKAIREKMASTDESPRTIAQQMNRLQVSDEGEIEKIVAEVLKENDKAAQDVKNGEAKAIGFLVGQVMAKSQGKANPGLAQQIIRKQLGL